MRASESPIAIACLRLFTVLPDLPLFSVPRFLRRIALSTISWALGPYFLVPELLRGELLPVELLLPDDFFFVPDFVDPFLGPGFVPAMFLSFIFICFYSDK